MGLKVKAEVHAPPSGEATTHPGYKGNRASFTIHPRAKKPRACKSDSES